MFTLSVIIPTLNEAERIGATIANVRLRLPGTQVVVADGGSDDGTVRVAADNGVQIVHAPRGRGGQCRAGAASATGNVLFFLHADTRLPTDAEPVLTRYFARPEVLIGTFRLAFDDPSLFLRASAWFTRFDSVFTRFGDQGIAVRRSCYDALGGFPNWPLFEDVELLRRARRVTRVWSFPAEVITSSRRFRRRGLIRQQMHNGRLLLRFLLGAAPDSLSRSYSGDTLPPGRTVSPTNK